MSTKASQRLEANDRTRLRARWELLAFQIEEPGRVIVTNESYGKEADQHQYQVTVADGMAVACTCPAFEFHPGLCKHAHAVNAEPILLATADEDGPHWSRSSSSSCPHGIEGCPGPFTDQLPCFGCFCDLEAAR